MMRTFAFFSLCALLASGASAQTAKLKDIGRDAMEVCALDLKGGDARALLSTKGYDLDSQTLRLQFYKKHSFDLTARNGKTFKHTPVIAILKRAKRKRLSECTVHPNLGPTSSNIIFSTMQDHAKRLGYETNLTRSGVSMRKDGFAMRLSGTIHTSYVSIRFTRFSN